MVTKEQIIQLLQNNDKAVIRALIVTKVHNGRGFRPCHAQMGTSMANFYSRNQYLTQKQIAYWRVLDKKGKMRIEIYAGQLLEVAMSKQSKV